MTQQPDSVSAIRDTVHTVGRYVDGDDGKVLYNKKLQLGGDLKLVTIQCGYATEFHWVLELAAPS